MLSRDKRQPGSDDGVTLIELVVGMALSLIVITMTAGFFVNTMRTSNAAATDSIDTDQARGALDSWTRLLQVADSPSSPGTSTGRIVSLTATDIVFYSSVGKGAAATTSAPLKIWLSMAGGQLIERRYQPDTPGAVPSAYSTYPATPAVKRILLGCPTAQATSCASTPGNLSGTSAFVGYYPPASCAAGAVTVQGFCSAPSAGVTLDQIAAVGITITLTDPHGGATSTFTSFITLFKAAS